MGHLMDRYRVGIRRASAAHAPSCAVVRQSRAGWYYQPKEKDDAPWLRRMEEIAAFRVRNGFWRIYILLRRESRRVNHKRVYRLNQNAEFSSSGGIR